MTFVMMALKFCKILKCLQNNQSFPFVCNHSSALWDSEGLFPGRKAICMCVYIYTHTYIYGRALWYILSAVEWCLSVNLLHHFPGCSKRPLGTELWLHWNLVERSLWASGFTAILCPVRDQCHWKCLYSSSALTTLATNQQHTGKAISYFWQWLL